ncbi:MlaD family protein [Mycolicibacter minnesotensis]
MIVLAYLVARMLPERLPPNTIEIVLSTPTVGQGVDATSMVLLHGVQVGTVESVDYHAESADLRLRLDRGAITELTDSFGFDFRPANIWGMSAVSLTPFEAGGPLTDGQRIDREPLTNATVAQLLNTQMTLTEDVLTPDFFRLIKNSTQYITALLPFVESGFIWMTMLVDTQRESPVTLLQRTNRLLEPFPVFYESISNDLHSFRYLEDFEFPVNDIATVIDTLGSVRDDVIGQLAHILGKYRTELTPATEIGRAIADSISAMVQRSRGSLRLDKLLAGLAESYVGPDGGKSMNLRLVLESLPAMQSGIPSVPGPAGGTR